MDATSSYVNRLLTPNLHPTSSLDVSMTSGNRCCIEIRRHQTKDTGQRARQIMDAVSDNYATTRRDRYIRLTQKSNTKCFFFADHVRHVNKALKSAMSGANYVDGVSIMTD